MINLPRFSLVIAGVLSFPGAANTLKDYKKQKHEENRQVVTHETCPEEYVKTCSAKCAAGDNPCVEACKQEAPKFCEERDSRRTAKKWELVGKAATLGAGAFGMIFDNKMQEVTLDPNGNLLISPYAIDWNKSSFVTELSAGHLEAGAFGAGFDTSFRWKWIGFSGGLEYLWDGSENLTEADLGPSVFFATQHILVGLQPSVLLSGGNGVRGETGFGLRTNNMFILDERIFANFDPMLGHINGQWAYDLRAGVGYRMTPAWFLKLDYEYRDILDLNNLDVSESRFQGAFLSIGFRDN